MVTEGWVRQIRLDDEGIGIAALSDAGWEQVAAKGRDGFVEVIEADYRERGEAPPRGWRFVRRLFPEQGDMGPWFPQWRVLERSAATWGGEARITSDLAVFNGHFPNEPIVPGVAQLYWADKLARRAFPGQRKTLEVVRLKFVNVIVPGTLLRLNLERKGQSRVEFGYTSKDGDHSSGCLVAGLDEET